MSYKAPKARKPVSAEKSAKMGEIRAGAVVAGVVLHEGIRKIETCI
jgi:hypothetical protein